MQISSLSAATEAASDFTSAADSATRSLEKLAPLYMQMRMYNTQLKLAKAQAAQAGTTIDPNLFQNSQMSLPVSVGVAPDTQNMLLLGGLALLVVLLLSGKKKR